MTSSFTYQIVKYSILAIRMPKKELITTVPMTITKVRTKHQKDKPTAQLVATYLMVKCDLEASKIYLKLQKV